ncbi:MAG: MFS transporter, partial [Holosporaceae bacterium]
GAAVMVPAYRIGQLLAGAGGLALAQLAGWQVAWAAVGGCMIVGMVGTLLIRPQPPQQDAAPSPEQSPAPLPEQPAAPPSGWQTLRASFLNPLRHLLRQPNAWLLLLIILLYRLPDAFLAPMRVPLLLHVGFDKITLAEINKLVGFGATVLGGFVAHGLIQRLTLARVLWWGALAQGASNLLFLPLLWWGADRTLLTYAVAMDNLLGGIVSVAMVILLTRACRHPGYTASQYAVLSAVMSLSRTLVSGLTGLAADSLGWGGFLILTALLAIPVLPLLPRLRKSGLLF